MGSVSEDQHGDVGIVLKLGLENKLNYPQEKGQRSREEGELSQKGLPKCWQCPGWLVLTHLLEIEFKSQEYSSLGKRKSTGLCMPDCDQEEIPNHCIIWG